MVSPHLQWGRRSPKRTESMVTIVLSLLTQAQADPHRAGHAREEQLIRSLSDSLVLSRSSAMRISSRSFVFSLSRAISFRLTFRPPSVQNLQGSRALVPSARKAREAAAPTGELTAIVTRLVDLVTSPDSFLLTACESRHIR